MRSPAYRNLLCNPAFTVNVIAAPNSHFYAKCNEVAAKWDVGIS